MDVLIRYGFSIEEIQIMMDTNEEIGNVDDSVIYKLIEILEKINCDEISIKNIVQCNPFYLSKDVKSIKEFIELLYEYGFIDLNNLFDSNPYLLNISALEFENIFNTKIKEGFNNEEVINYFYYNCII